MNPRRRWLAAGVAGTPLLGAAGALWWRQRAAAPDQPAALQTLWRQPLPDLQGQQQTLEPWRGRPLVLNFWASWCGPCRRELPLLDQMANTDGLAVVALALDQADGVRRFLQTTPVHLPIRVLGPQGLALTRELGNTQGGLPFSLLLDATGRVLERHLGEVHPADVERWLILVR